MTKSISLLINYLNYNITTVTTVTITKNYMCIIQFTFKTNICHVVYKKAGK